MGPRCQRASLVWMSRGLTPKKGAIPSASWRPRSDFPQSGSYVQSSSLSPLRDSSTPSKMSGVEFVVKIGVQMSGFLLNSVFHNPTPKRVPSKESNSTISAWTPPSPHFRLSLIHDLGETDACLCVQAVPLGVLPHLFACRKAAVFLGGRPRKQLILGVFFRVSFLGLL